MFSLRHLNRRIFSRKRQTNNIKRFLCSTETLVAIFKPFGFFFAKFSYDISVEAASEAWWITHLWSICHSLSGWFTSKRKKSFKIRISLEKNYKTINKIKDLKTSSPERRLKKENRKVLRKSFEFSLQSIFTISRVKTIPIRKDFTLIFLSSLARTNDQQILKSISLQPLESKYGSMWFSKDFISFNYYFINFLGDIFSGWVWNAINFNYLRDCEAEKIILDWKIF